MSEGRTIGVKMSASERREWLKSLKVGDEVLVVSFLVTSFEVFRGRIVADGPPLVVRHRPRFSHSFHEDAFARSTGKMRGGDLVILPLSSRADEHAGIAHRLANQVVWAYAPQRVRDILKKEGLWQE